MTTNSRSLRRFRWLTGFRFIRFSASAQTGTHTSADVITAQTLVSQLADGLGLDELWEEFETIFNFWNTRKGFHYGSPDVQNHAGR